MVRATAGSDLRQRRRRAATIVALAGALGVFAIKGFGALLTGSTALLSDALESIVNVAASGFAFFAVRFASKPADREHPYGHGKMEHVAAAFEGGLITFAAGVILLAAVRSLFTGPRLRSIDEGLAIAAASALANLALGAFLVREGKATASPTLVADGKHVLSDVWTTVGALVGLGLARVSGNPIFDPLAAFLVGLALARTGILLVKNAVNALLDREDPELLQKLVDAFNSAPMEGLTGLHRLRALRTGDEIHIDAHVFVPEHWSVRQAHEAVVALERWITERTGLVGELALHLDPCRAEPCPNCDLPECPTRRVDYRKKKAVTVDEAVLPVGEPPADH